MSLDHSAPATAALLDDLRSDRDMGWVPKDAWLTKVAIDADAPQLRFDLAIDASGAGAPSPVAAGLVAPGAASPDLTGLTRWVVGLSFTIGGIGGILLLIRRRPADGGMTPA